MLHGGASPERELHAEWLLQLGNNETPIPVPPHESCTQSGGKRVSIPGSLKVSSEEALLQHVYSNETLREAKVDPQAYFTKRALMATLNATCKRLNEVMTNRWKAACPELVSNSIGLPICYLFLQCISAFPQ